MKLLLENWRKYLTDENNYGLYEELARIVREEVQDRIWTLGDHQTKAVVPASLPPHLRQGPALLARAARDLELEAEIRRDGDVPAEYRHRAYTPPGVLLYNIEKRVRKEFPDEILDSTRTISGVPSGMILLKPPADDGALYDVVVSTSRELSELADLTKELDPEIEENIWRMVFGTRGGTGWFQALEILRTIGETHT